MGKSAELGLPVCSSKQGLFLSVHVDDIQMAGLKQNMAPMWKKLMKNVEFLTIQLHFLTTFVWDALNVNASRTISLLKSTVANFLLEQLKNYQGGIKLTQRRARGHTTWKDMLKHVLRDIANGRTKRQSNCTKFQVLDHHFKNEELESVGESSKVCSQKCFEMLVLGTHWKTRHFVVGQQTCKSSHKMDSGMRHTIGRFLTFR